MITKGGPRIQFHYRREITDYTELMEMLLPGNRHQQHAGGCIFFELKWADGLVPNLSYLQEKYGISRRILERTRAKLSRLGLIEHISYLNARYHGRSGWKLASRFAQALRRLADKTASFRNPRQGSPEKERLLLDLADARRGDRNRRN